MSTNTSNRDPIILYDIPRAEGPVTWSPNVWRTRMALNYKGLHYKTEWVEYPDIERVGKEIGAKPTGLKPDGSGDGYWTCPMIVDPNHRNSEGKPTVLSDSYAIARYLDEAYPEPMLFPEGSHALHIGWARYVTSRVHEPLARLLLPMCPDILSLRSKEYFIRTREAWYGPLNEMCPDRPKVWKNVQEGLDSVAAALDANGVDGEQNLRVIPGRTSYADFSIMGVLLWAVAIVPNEESDPLEGWNDGRWGRILDLHANLLRIE
ncbi:hypothetical protein FPV67DRAFT_1508058 [Lyophyllum atratum]|nr:hypothetical protein FPV67DRAFT_1508058 [Lyophyllum atratum]